MKIKNILLTGVAVLTLASCNDFLDVEAPSAYTPDFVFSQKTEIERALNGVYAQALVNNLYGNLYHQTFTLNSDVDITISSASSHQHDTYQRFDCDIQGKNIYDFWTAAYSLIESANKFIASAEACKFITKPDDADSDWEVDADVLQWIGEAKCLRAMIYHDLVVMFGDIPFKFEPTKENDFVPPVVDREVIQKTLIEDLQKVSTNMRPTTDKSVTVERCSKEFAQALIARIALTAGGYSLRPDKDNPRNYGTMMRPENWEAYYQIARDYADSVITAGRHHLNNTYQQVFVNECNYLLANEDDPIFEIPFAKNSTGNIGYSQGPTYSSYESKTVGPWGECKGNARLNAFYRFLFRDGDKRREFVNGLWYYTYKNDNGTLTDSIVIRNDYSVHNNKWSKLWTAEGNALGNSTTGSTGINYPYMRYADVLLMFAEADNELSQTPSAKAINCLTEVHKRAFANGDPTFIAQAQTDKDAFRKAVLDERKWEFAGENSRWRDLVRTNTYAEEVMYSFLRYYSVGMQNAQGLTGYEDAINEHDGRVYIDKLPSNVYYHKYYINEGTDAQQMIAHRLYAAQFYGYTINSTTFAVEEMYPNQSLPSLRIFNAYKSATKPTKGTITMGGFSAPDWSFVTFYEWGNNNNGTPKDQCKYSFYGFIRSDDNGNIWMIRNGNMESFSNILPADQLPVVRYILPYPNLAIQRSGGVYKNYYGYNN